MLRIRIVTLGVTLVYVSTEVDVMTVYTWPGQVFVPRREEGYVSVCYG